MYQVWHISRQVVESQHDTYALAFDACLWRDWQEKTFSRIVLPVEETVINSDIQ